MKKKLTYFLLAILVVPIFALFGCKDVNTNSFSVNTYGTGSVIIEGGSMGGTKDVNDGSTVTMIATSTKNDIIGWIFQGSTLIADGSTYSIKNTKTDNKITKSVLSFKSSASTSGAYTAVFNEPEMTYVKLSSWKVTSDLTKESESDSATKPTVMTISMDVIQGTTVRTDALGCTDYAVKDNVEIAADTNEVLNLQNDNQQVIVQNAEIMYNQSRYNYQSMVVNLTWGENYESDKTSVEYSNGVYKVSFKFNLPSTQYYLVLYYKALNA